MFYKNLSNFIQSFSRLPGIGAKTSERLGFYILSQSIDFANHLSESILNLKKNSVICSICGNLYDQDPCYICSDPSRLNDILCVVENPIDIYFMEMTNSFKGVYHVLGGLLSPLNGVTPKDLRINELFNRLNHASIKEILFATSPTTEGDSTALYIKEMLKDKDIKLTHLARGIPVGTGLQYASHNSLIQAIKGREEI